MVRIETISLLINNISILTLFYCNKTELKEQELKRQENSTFSEDEKKQLNVMYSKAREFLNVFLKNNPSKFI